MLLSDISLRYYFSPTRNTVVLNDYLGTFGLILVLIGYVVLVCFIAILKYYLKLCSAVYKENSIVIFSNLFRIKMSLLKFYSIIICYQMTHSRKFLIISVTVYLATIPD